MTGAMRAELWPRIREVFELSLDADDVQAVLERECAGDVELRDAVLALHASDAAAESLEPPSMVERGGAAPVFDVGPGDRVGGFVVRRELERGGMGVVFEAEQLEPQRLVALKVLPADHDGPALTQRMATEAEILARLQHPGIAAVYAAGVHTLPDGTDLPYLAMELVEGARGLLDYANAEGLDLASRLQLFRGVCDAVHAAHQKGVIHRDLKPSNLLVDADGRVRVIDFGIAHVFGHDGPSRGTQGVFGTPGYVSPERVLYGDGGHDVRSDVFSLGVILAQLGGDALPRQAQWIAERARAADPEERYPSAVDLAADVGRFLAREPVLARPSTAGYRAWCFARRHSAGVTAASAVIVLLIAGLVSTSLGWSEASRQEGAARQEARRSGALRDVLRSLIVEASPQRLGPSVGLLEAIDTIVDEIEPAFEGEFDLQVVALCDVAHVQLDIGQWRRARDLLQRAVEIAERHLPESRELAEALNLFGLAQTQLLESDEPIATFRRALAIEAQLDDKSAILRESIERNLASVVGRAGELPQAVRDLEKAYRASAMRYGDDDPNTLGAGNQLAEAYRSAGRLKDALSLSERLLASWRDRGVDSVRSMIRLHNHAHLLEQLDRAAEALAIEREVVERWPAVVGAEHPHVATALQTAGVFALAAEEYVEAVGYLEQLQKHPSMADATPRQRSLRPLLLACALVACGPERYADALPVLTAGLEDAARHEGGKAGAFVWLARAAAARVALQVGDPDHKAALKRAHAELCDQSGAVSWPARLVARWLAER